MIILNGQSVCGYTAFGKLTYYRRGRQQVTRRKVENVHSEIARYEKAKAQTIAQLDALYEKALAEVGEQEAQLFQIHQMMLEDEDYCDSIINTINRKQINAEYAVAVTADNFTKMFSEMDNPYMQGRASDVRDISERLINILSGHSTDGMLLNEPVIIAADDLVPSETVQLDKSKILAFITADGSASSHTAILARTIGIPTIIGVGDALNESFDGLDAIVDGSAGTVYINPDEQTVILLREKQNQERKKRQLLEQLKGQQNITLDGKQIMLHANIGSPADIGAVLQNDADGIGLFRSEFLYLESNDYPTENKQFQVYKNVAETMAGKRVIIRTLDIGADKQTDYFQLPKEENPALGLRAIRICLTRPKIFKTQLRALYRASAYGKIAIMFPMISSLEEVYQIKEIVKVVRDELTSDGLPFSSDVELGIMIETPAAAIISDLLAKEVDFFSIGTNDLTQYTLAVDRQNQSLGSFCNLHHEALLRLIGFVTDNAHKAGIWVGICGELGADPELTATFLAMGVDELSVCPPEVLPLRDRIRQINVGNVSPYGARLSIYT